MNPKHITPYIRIASYDIQNTHFCFDRTIWDFELIYLYEGKMKLTINNEEYHCIPGDFILLRPRVHHILESETKYVIQPHCHFDLFEDNNSPHVFIPFVRENKMSPKQKKWFRKDVLPELGMDLPPVIRLNDSIAIKDILLKLIEEFSYKKPYSEYMQHALLVQLLTQITRSYNLSLNKSIYGKHINELDEVIKYIHSHVDNILSLDDLARESNISKFYLSRLFKAAFHETPHKYIAKIRIKRAKELIQFSDLSIKSIAYKMSFSDQQAFSRWFKSIDGYSPIQYRINKNAHQEKNDPGDDND